MKKYQIEMPDGCEPSECINCDGYTRRRNNCDNPLSHSVEATANADLVGELMHETTRDYGVQPDDDACEVDEFWVKKIRAILSKYHPVKDVKEQGGEGLREAVKDVYEDIMLNEDTEYDDAESVAVKLGEILMDTPTPVASGLPNAKADEPKDCGFTLATCPYERCSGITKRADKVEEPLAVLADRKGCWIERIMPIPGNTWRIVISGVEWKSFRGDTYAECEAKARQYLEALPDKPTGQGKEMK